MGRIRPQIMVAILTLGAIAGGGFYVGWNEAVTACIAGIIALAKDIIGVDGPQDGR